MRVFCFSLPVSEGGPSGEEHCFSLWLWLVKEPKKRVILNTDFPEVFTLIPTSQKKLQCILIWALGKKTEKFSST